MELKNCCSCGGEAGVVSDCQIESESSWRALFRVDMEARYFEMCGVGVGELYICWTTVGGGGQREVTAIVLQMEVRGSGIGSL